VSTIDSKALAHEISFIPNIPQRLLGVSRVKNFSSRGLVSNANIRGSLGVQRVSLRLLSIAIGNLLYVHRRSGFLNPVYDIEEQQLTAMPYLCFFQYLWIKTVKQVLKLQALGNGAIDIRCRMAKSLYDTPFVTESPWSGCSLVNGRWSNLVTQVIAVGQDVREPDLYAEALALRQTRYETRGYIEVGAHLEDNYDPISVHLATVDLRRADSGKANYVTGYFRLIIDNGPMLPVAELSPEIHSDGLCVEVSKYVVQPEATRPSHAIAQLEACLYSIEQLGCPTFAVVSKAFTRLLEKRKVDLREIGPAVTMSQYGDEENQPIQISNQRVWSGWKGRTIGLNADMVA